MTKTGRPDTLLLASAQQGDARALEQLLCQCRPDIERYARRTCLVSHIDDAVQESSLLVWVGLPRLRSHTAFSRWLFQIVRRECLRMRDKFGVGLLPLDAAETASEAAYLSGHDDAAMRIDIARALQSLPDIYREVILLRDMKTLGVGEIAAQLGLPRETVKTRLARARGLVREYLLSDETPSQK